MSACPPKFDRPRATTAMPDRTLRRSPARAELRAVKELYPPQHVSLRDGDLWVAPRDGARIVEVRCVAGAVWITREGHAEDMVLSAGGRFDIRSDGKLIVQALEDAVIHVGV